MIDPAAIAAVQAKLKPAAAMILAVEWSDVLTKYYADRAYNELPPFHRIGHVIEPRLLGQNSNFENCSFDLNPDLRTEQIPFTFDDLDKSITTLFQIYGSGVRCEIFFYYPNNEDPSLDIWTSVWFGTLKAPNIFGWSRLQTVATNGFRSREFTIPSSLWPEECRTKAFGGRFTNPDIIRTLICPYDLAAGGTTGIVDPSTGQPFLDCPRLTKADCSARFGHDRFFGGINVDAAAVVTNTQGYVAVSKGNQSALKVPIRVIAGSKYVRDNLIMLWRREFGAQDPTHNWVAMIAAVSEGPVRNIRDIKVNEKIIESNLRDWVPGDRGQRTVFGYGPVGTHSNFSGLAHLFARYGWVDPLQYTPANLKVECRVDGYREVTVFNEAGPGNGLIGTYYLGNAFSGTPVGIRVDHWINFTSSQNPPMEGMPYYEWCCRWTGKIKPRYSETYTIKGEFDDKMKVVINGTTLFDGTVYTESPLSGTIALTADTEYDIQIDFVQGPGSAINPWKCILSWQSSSQALEVVPSSRLIHPGASGYVRQWTDDRIWWLLECYTSNRFGMGYPFSRFWTEDFKSTSDWGLQTVSYTHTYSDGETKVLTGRRTTFNASLEGRSAVEQIEDICRSGAVSFPFQHDGKYTVSPFRIATSGELSAAKVFTDTGANKNIVWGEGQPSIYLQKTPDEVLLNEIILTFEEDNNFDLERPITVDDPDQKLRAGRQLGESNFQTVPKRLAAFGVKYEQEAVRLARRWLKFGEFDQGGIDNNLRAVFTTPFEQVLGIKRYEIIELQSQLLNGHQSPQSEPFVYFRILNLKKLANGLCEITAQAYNQTAYEAFEVVTVSNPEPPGPHQLPPNGPSPQPCTPTINVTYDSANGFIEVEPIPC